MSKFLFLFLTTLVSFIGLSQQAAIDIDNLNPSPKQLSIPLPPPQVNIDKYINQLLNQTNVPITQELIKFINEYINLTLTGNLIKPCGPDNLLCQNLTTPNPFPTFVPSFLFCYTCNENWAACKTPLDRVLTAGNLNRCHGQCVRFQNPNDGLKTYRGCSTDYGFITSQPGTVLFNNVIYHFCDTNGCNDL